MVDLRVRSVGHERRAVSLVVGPDEDSAAAASGLRDAEMTECFRGAKLCGLLVEEVHEPHFAVDCVVLFELTRGGESVAEFIGQLLFQEIPVETTFA